MLEAAEKSSIIADTLLKWHLQKLLQIVLIYTSAFQIDFGSCVIPEASHEGGLRSFKSYEDVVLFHYHVPKQVLRATWQFSAYSENSKCKARTVNIFLKHGSYPIVIVNNATYPSNMIINEDDTIKLSTVTKYESKDMAIVPVYSPEPGDWFVGAYLSHWDENVYQKGLGLECRYSLGSIAVWSICTGIQNIPLGYQISIETNESISYFKIYIPIGVSKFQIDLWGCNVTVKNRFNFRNPCIKNVALKGRTMPVSNHNNSKSIVNMTSIDTYTLVEDAPFQDSWYYLMITSSDPIKFDIKITVTDCPIIAVEDYSIPNNFLNSIKQNDLLTNEMEDYTNNCYPRYRLERIASESSVNYLLKGKTSLTPWLVLRHNLPAIVQFDILPLIDIGGTLEINFVLEIEKSLINQQISVSICINPGHLPQQANGQTKCDSKHYILELSTADSQNVSLMIPYPKPDTWYIALQPQCFINGLKVHCEKKDILLSFNIQLRKCVFKGRNSCSSHGVCKQINRGFLYYTACKCSEGWQGWACTDGSMAVTDFSALLETLILTMSNLFFIPAIYVALRRRLYTAGLVYFSTMIFSSLYHACDQQYTHYCIAKYDVLQYVDFFMGMLSFWVTLISMADLAIELESFCNMLGAIIVTFGVQSDKSALVSVLIPLVIGSLFPLSSYGYYCFKMKQVMLPKRFIKLIIGLISAILGILLYSFVETESNYKYVHSSWHVIIALSPIFLLPPIKTDDMVQTNNGCNEFDENPNHDITTEDRSLLINDYLVENYN